jgi:hypothetical protein
MKRIMDAEKFSEKNASRNSTLVFPAIIFPPLILNLYLLWHIYLRQNL